MTELRGIPQRYLQLLPHANMPAAPEPVLVRNLLDARAVPVRDGGQCLTSPYAMNNIR